MAKVARWVVGPEFMSNPLSMKDDHPAVFRV
jgi:hypothetical protein